MGSQGAVVTGDAAAGVSLAEPAIPAVDHLPRSGTGAVLAGALRPACRAEAPGTDGRAVVTGFGLAENGGAKGGVVAADATGGGAGAVETTAAVAHLLGAGEGTRAVLAGAVRPTAGSRLVITSLRRPGDGIAKGGVVAGNAAGGRPVVEGSEEARVGQECGARRTRDH